MLESVHCIHVFRFRNMHGSKETQRAPTCCYQCQLSHWMRMARRRLPTPSLGSAPLRKYLTQASPGWIDKLIENCLLCSGFLFCCFVRTTRTKERIKKRLTNEKKGAKYFIFSQKIITNIFNIFLTYFCFNHVHRIIMSIAHRYITK